MLRLLKFFNAAGIFLLFGHSGHLCMAQTVDVQVDDLQLLAEFQDASSLAIDPAGKMYVVDEGAHLVHFIDPNNNWQKQQFGGPGEGEGQFDTPGDIDVTNGLVLVVADAGNGRIQRFSREFLFLESLPVGSNEGSDADAIGGEPAYRQREQEFSSQGTGRPIALITSQANETYAIDERDNVVVKWDENRNLEQHIGSYDQGAGSLVEPVSLALNSDGGLYVADRGHESIMVYDAFGGFDRTVASGFCKEAQSVYIHQDQLLIVLSDKLLLYHVRGMPELTLGFALEESLVDVAIHDNRLYILTEKQLYDAGAWRW